MLQLTATMQTDYNGWTVGNEDDSDPKLFDMIADALPDITYEAYDEDGDCVGNPTAYDNEVKAKILELANQPCDITIEYDDFSS